MERLPRHPSSMPTTSSPAAPRRLPLPRATSSAAGPPAMGTGSSMVVRCLGDLEKAERARAGHLELKVSGFRLRDALPMTKMLSRNYQARLWWRLPPATVALLQTAEELSMSLGFLEIQVEMVEMDVSGRVPVTLALLNQNLQTAGETTLGCLAIFREKSSSPIQTEALDAMELALRSMDIAREADVLGDDQNAVRGSLDDLERKRSEVLARLGTLLQDIRALMDRAIPLPIAI